MKWFAWMLHASLLCAAWSGCAGTETGNPSFTGSLGYDAYSSRPDQVALRATAITRVDSAWFVLGDVDFATTDECQAMNAAEAHAEGLGPGDHAATQAPPTRFEFGEGNYCQVQLPFEKAAPPPAGAPAELAGQSILIRGALPDGRKFELASTYSGTVRIEAPSAPGFVLDEAQPAVVLGFDLATWLGSVEWPSGSGDVRIDATNNEPLLRAFEARIARGVALFRDEDGDGELDIDPIELARGVE